MRLGPAGDNVIVGNPAGRTPEAPEVEQGWRVASWTLWFSRVMGGAAARGARLLGAGWGACGFCLCTRPLRLSTRHWSAAMGSAPMRVSDWRVGRAQGRSCPRIGWAQQGRARART